MLIQETFVDLTAGHTIENLDPYEPHTDNPGELFRRLQKVYGRCTGKVYIDGDEPAAVGWVFQRREKYDDCSETYLREVWVTLHSAPPTRTIEYHYHHLS